jgi:hypothetical protein
MQSVRDQSLSGRFSNSSTARRSKAASSAYHLNIRIAGGLLPELHGEMAKSARTEGVHSFKLDGLRRYQSVWHGGPSNLVMVGVILVQQGYPEVGVSQARGHWRSIPLGVP